jgi:histidine triad (HIT) family protein
MTDSVSCPFCVRIKSGEGEYDFVSPSGRVVGFEPLNPVTPGHRLFVPVRHWTTSAGGLYLVPIWMAAMDYANARGEAFNLIISSGAEATQTVEHAHLHYVPRRLGDGLLLPWSNPSD